MMVSIVAQMVIRPKLDLRPGAVNRGLIDEYGRLDHRRFVTPRRIFVLSNGDRFIEIVSRSAAASRLEMRQRGLIS